jgi:hypothetical protein
MLKTAPDRVIRSESGFGPTFGSFGATMDEMIPGKLLRRSDARHVPMTRPVRLLKICQLRFRTSPIVKSLARQIISVATGLFCSALGGE